MKKLMYLIVVMVSVSGCAFTVHDVEVNYQYDQAVEADLSPAKIVVGQFKDSRNVDNPRMIMNQKNGYGQTTTGGWQAEKPLNEIVKDAVTDGLKQAGARINSPDANLLLTGDLLSFVGEIKMGFWKGSYEGAITVKMQLAEKRTGEIVWRDTFIGSGEVEADGGPEQVLKVALDNLVSNLLSDQYFLQKAVRK